MGPHHGERTAQIDSSVRRAAFSGLAVLAIGVLVLCAATAWSAVDYNLREAAGAVDSGPPSAVLATPHSAIVLMAIGFAVALTAAIVLVIRSTAAASTR